MYFIFFFQAEDGIRDVAVTGVQTCALPISFFLQLRSAYQAELDDLTSDSEGRGVLRQRLAEKRQELGFLVKMIEISPRSEEHTSELQSRLHLVCRLLLEKQNSPSTVLSTKP